MALQRETLFKNMSTSSANISLNVVESSYDSEDVSSESDRAGDFSLGPEQAKAGALAPNTEVLPRHNIQPNHRPPQQFYSRMNDGTTDISEYSVASATLPQPEPQGSGAEVVQKYPSSYLGSDGPVAPSPAKQGAKVVCPSQTDALTFSRYYLIALIIILVALSALYIAGLVLSGDKLALYDAFPSFYPFFYFAVFANLFTYFVMVGVLIIIFRTRLYPLKQRIMLFVCAMMAHLVNICFNVLNIRDTAQPVGSTANTLRVLMQTQFYVTYGLLAFYLFVKLLVSFSEN